MLSNRSIAPSVVIPVLAYPDVNAAADWLCAAFGFRVRLRIGTHRVQMHVGDGAVTLRELRPGDLDAPLGLGHSITVRVEDVDTHCRRARTHGAQIVMEPSTHPFGERQYNVLDPAGHLWTFSQSVADVAPEDWGGTSVEL
jgi:uncharacterized glyoxalase superfamily protein PhnB